MRRKNISSNYITDASFCQCLQGCGRFWRGILAVILILSGILVPRVVAIEYTDVKGAAIIDNCSAIKNDLKNVQKSDSKARLYLGGRYETILTKYVKVLNVKLVESDKSSIVLLENQNQLTKTKMRFVDDFVMYQRGLEELIAMDCKVEPEHFYEKLEKVRGERAKVKMDVDKMRALLGQHTEAVGGMIGEGDATTAE